ncbi:hypothetical protein Tco_1159013 [Tanacetum coccineum]
MIISELKERLCKKDFDNEHLKSKVVEELKVQVKELKSENEGLKLSVEELTKAHELIEEIGKIVKHFDEEIKRDRGGSGYHPEKNPVVTLLAMRKRET